MKRTSAAPVPNEVADLLDRLERGARRGRVTTNPGITRSELQRLIASLPPSPSPGARSPAPDRGVEPRES